MRWRRLAGDPVATAFPGVSPAVVPGCQTGPVTSARTGVVAPPVWVTWASEGAWSGRDLLLAEACRWTSLPAAAVRVTSSCPECGSNRHGRPLLLSPTGAEVPHVSLSRAAGIVVVALTRTGPVGVDVEVVGGASFDGFGEVALHVTEQADGPVEQTVTWVRKESLLKAAGRGLGTDMRSVRLGSPGLPPGVLSWATDDRPAGAGIWMFDVSDVAADYAVSVTVLSVERPTLVTRRATEADPFRPTTP